MKSCFLFLGLAFFAQARKVNVSCGSCSGSCTTGSKCYILEGDDGKTINEEICVGSDTCPTSGTFEYNAVNCDIDYSGQQCGSKACVYPVGVEICDTTNSLCGVGYDVSVECGQCQSTSGCSYCMITTTSGANTETCVDQYLDSCEWTYEVTYGSCSEDSFGVSCSCCAESSFTGNTGTCTDNDPIFSQSTEINEYAYGELIKASLLMLLLLIFA